MITEIATYLVDSGVEEGEVDHLVRQKYFGGKSIMDYIVDGDTTKAWASAYSWITGEDFDYLSALDGKTLHKRYN